MMSAERPCGAKLPGNSVCFVGGCGNTAETKLTFKFPDKGERREAWCSALDVNPNLDVAGRSRLLKGAVVCQDHFVLEEDVENYMYFRLMGGKVKLKKSAVPRLAVTPNYESAGPSAVTAVEKETPTEQEKAERILDELSPLFPREMNPYVKLKRLGAAEIVNAIYPAPTYGIICKPRIMGVDEPQPKPEPSDDNTARKMSLLGVPPVETTPSEVAPANAAPAGVTPPKVKPPKVTPPNIMPLNVTPGEVTQNISRCPRSSPLKAVQPNILPQIKSGISDTAHSPQLSIHSKPKFTCHHCDLKFVALGALRSHVSKHLDLSSSKVRPKKNKFCCVPVCHKSTERDLDTLFFRAPRSMEKWLKWSDIFGIVNVDYTRCKHTRFVVCEDHFYKKDIIVKGENVGLKKNALPKKPISLHLKTKSNSGAEKRIRKITRSHGTQQASAVNNVTKRGPSAAESATGGCDVPGKTAGQLKLDYIQKLVKCGFPNGTGSPGQKRVPVPISEVLKSGRAQIVSNAKGERKLILPVSQEHKPGYPTKRLMQIINLPAGTRVTNQLKIVHTMGPSKIGWTAAMNKQIASTTAENAQLTDADEAEAKANASEADANPGSDGDDPTMKRTSLNAAEPSQRTSPSTTKLVQSGRNMILVRTKPDPPQTSESHAEAGPVVQNEQSVLQKYRPGPKCSKPKREKKPARPTLKVNKGVTEIRFRVEQSGINPAKPQRNTNPTTSIAKTASENPQILLDVKPMVLPSPIKVPKRGRTKPTKIVPTENGKIGPLKEMDTFISGYRHGETETSPTSKSTVVAVAAPNNKYEPKKYRPGPKCFKDKLEGKTFPTDKEIISSGPKLTRPTNSGNLVMKTSPVIKVSPTTRSILGKRRRTDRSNKVDSAHSSTPPQLIVITTSYPPNTTLSKVKHPEASSTPYSKPNVQREPQKYRPGPRCFKMKFEEETQPHDSSSSPSPNLIIPAMTASMKAAQADEFIQPKTTSILGKRRRIKQENGVDLPGSIPSTPPHRISRTSIESCDSAEANPSPASELETFKAPFTPKFEKPTTRHSTGKLKKSRIFDDFETDESPRTSPTKNSRSPNSSPKKNIRPPLFNAPMLGTTTGACRASTSHLAVSNLANFLTPSPPAKRAKLMKISGPSSLTKVHPWNRASQNSHLPPRIVVAKLNQNGARQSNQGEFACYHCGEKFYTKPQLKLHIIICSPSCVLQVSSSDLSETGETLSRKMPTTGNDIKTCFDIVERIWPRTSAYAMCEDPFEDKFPVVKQEDKKPAYIRDWSQHPIDPPLIRFSGLTPGFKPAEFGSSPFDYFLHFVTPEFLQETCTATNRNIERVRTEMQDRSSVALLTVEELMSFLAVVLLHFAVLGGVSEWLGDYGLPVGTCLTRDRFKFILRVLSFSKKAEAKTSPLLDYFNNRMRRIANPPKQLLLSDSAILQNDSLVYSRFFDYPAYQGILNNLSGQDGTVYRICLKRDAVHPTGRDSFPNPVIDSLMSGLFDKGYSLYMNQFYCSVQLAEDLLQRKTYCTGTVRNSRAVAPPEIHRAVPEQLLVMGRSTHTTTSYYTKDGICYTKWDEGREVMCVSSEWGATMVGNQEFVRPKMYHNYTEIMANPESEGVPPMPRLFLMQGDTEASLTLQILAILIRNAYILYSNDRQTVSSNPPITFADFHFELVKHLLAYPTTVTVSPYVQSHLPSLIEGVRHNSVLMPRKMCDGCAERATLIFCKSCPASPSLCPKCYRTHHEQITILIFKNLLKT